MHGALKTLVVFLSLVVHGALKTLVVLLSLGLHGALKTLVNCVLITRSTWCVKNGSCVLITRSAWCVKNGSCVLITRIAHHTFKVLLHLLKGQVTKAQVCWIYCYNVAWCFKNVGSYIWTSHRVTSSPVTYWEFFYTTSEVTIVHIGLIHCYNVKNCNPHCPWQKTKGHTTLDTIRWEENEEANKKKSYTSLTFADAEAEAGVAAPSAPAAPAAQSTTESTQSAESADTAETAAKTAAETAAETAQTATPLRVVLGVVLGVVPGVVLVPERWGHGDHSDQKHSNDADLHLGSVKNSYWQFEW